MAARPNTRPILTACMAAGLAVSLAGCGGSTGSGFLAAPRLPADAPPMRSTATAPNDAGIPALGLPSGSGAPYSAQMTPGPIPGVDAILARLDELDSRITGLQQQFQAAEPAISRLTRIDGDIRALLSQMEGAVAARSQDAPVARAVTSRPASRADQTTLTMATPVGPLAAPPAQLLTASPSAPPAGAPAGPLSDPNSLRLSLSPEPARNMPAPQQAASQQTAPQQVTPQQASPQRAQTAMPEALTAAVHLASYRSVENARDGWRILQRRHPAELGTLVPMVLEVELGGERGRMLRLQASALTPGEARNLCERLKRAGQFCTPTADGGAPLSLAGVPPVTSPGTPLGTPVAALR